MSKYAVETIDHSVKKVSRSSKRFSTEMEAENYAIQLAKLQVLGFQHRGVQAKLCVVPGIRVENYEYLVVEI